jgi:hypothetical protein
MATLSREEMTKSICFLHVAYLVTSATTFEDTLKLRNRVHDIFDGFGTLIEIGMRTLTSPSSWVCVTPLDRFPPLAGEGLICTPFDCCKLLQSGGLLRQEL